MRLALIGKDISHSRSPELYKKLIGPAISYDLLDFDDASKIPSVEELATSYDAVNITSPYKTHFLSAVKIHDPLVQSLGAINTILLNAQEPTATNTDLLAIREILISFLKEFSSLNLIILGGGVMAKLCMLLAEELSLSYHQFTRSSGFEVDLLDLSQPTKNQTIIINCCSRKFEFKGRLHSTHIFWDMNYNFLPHQQRIPPQVKSYVDGQQLLELQAAFAVKFWRSNLP